MYFQDLPPELIEDILLHCDPMDVAKVAQTSKFFRTLIYFSEDGRLWRGLYLSQLLDDPRACVSQNGIPKLQPINWKKELQRFVRAQNVVEDLALLKPGEMEQILQTLLGLVTFVPPLSCAVTMDEISANIAYVATLLRKGFLDDVEKRPGVTFAERQLRAKLHTYYGLTHADITRLNRVKSRAFVYSMRNYRPENDYGPFLATGVVNWEHVQAIHHVVSMHLVDLREDEDFEFAVFPMSFPFTQVVVPPGVDLDEERDWAGVEGSWAVSFCFCDHRDLLRYNDMNTHQVDNSLFEDPTFREVFRSLDVNLCVTRTEPDPKHPTRPILHFFGEMENPSTSTMEGSVRMTRNDQIQWHFVSGDQGNAIWSSEGVQVGGVRSSFGILGAWTTIFHDADDPVGPFWLRKHLHDEEEAS